MNILTVVAAFALFQTPSPAADPPKQDPPKPQGLLLQSGDWSLKFYGFLRTDVFYDDSRPNNVLLPAAIKSEESAANVLLFPGVAQEKGSADFEISPRLTRFGFDLNGPVATKFGEAKLSGKFEIDFYGNATSDSRAELRMRHAYVKMGWDSFSLLAGQTADIISPLTPAVNNDLVMWGAGNLGDRRPMIMGDYRAKAGDYTIGLQAEIGVTGADDNQNLDGANTAFDGVASGIPTTQGRFSVKGPHFWIDKKTFEIGFWGHSASEKLDVQGAFSKKKFKSQAYGADLSLPLHDMVEVRGEVWSGKNLDDVRGGIFQGVATIAGVSKEIESSGGWAELVIKPCDWWTLHVGGSRDNPINSEIPAPTAATVAPTGAIGNYIFYVANRLALGGGLTIGVDYLNWTTKWQGALEDGTDNRVDIFFQWSY